jgi:hypothetical protein
MSKSGAFEPITLPMITACVKVSLPLTTGSTCAKAARPKPIKICVEVSIYLPPFKFDFGSSPLWLNG